MSEITDTLAGYVSELVFDDLPDVVVERARLLLLDFVGNTGGARYEAETTPQLVETAEALCWRGGDATVLGLSADFAPPAAALLNGALAHSLEFDDTHAAASLHPGATVIPAVLAASEMVDANGRDLLTAMVAGIEVACRVSKALVPAQHYERGFHPTATAGTFGAAAAAARVFALSRESVVSALGIAGSQASGSMQFMANAGWNKRFHVGAASHNGVVAATLARQGYLGASAAIEGDKGFLQAYAPAPQPELAIEALGEQFETLAVALKPYPTCRLAHAALDGILDLKREHRFAVDQVKSVEIGLSQLALDITGQPQSQKRRPRNFVEGQFSMHTCAAIALQQGSLTWTDYKQLWERGETKDMADRVSVCHDEDVEADYPERLSGRVLITVGADVFETKVDVPSGEPERFLSSDEIRGKFAGLATSHIGDDRISAIADVVANADKLNSARELTRATLASETGLLGEAAAE